MDTIPPEAFLAAYPSRMRALAEQLRAVVRAAVPDAIERVRPGWRLIGYDAPAGRRTVYFAYVAPEPGHVHLGFEHGYAMRDPGGLLQDGNGRARRVRWLTFEEGDPVDAAVLVPLVREAAHAAMLTPGERQAVASGEARRLER